MISYLREYIKHYQETLTVNLFGERDSFKVLGSTSTIVIYLGGAAALLTYCVYLFKMMFELNRDAYQTVMAGNDFSEPYNDIKIDDLNFLPYLDVRLFKDLDTTRHDVYSDDLIGHGGEEHGGAVNFDFYAPMDYKKMSKYISVQLSLR